MYKIIRYNVKQRGEQVQNLLDRYMIPTYLKRMGLKPEQKLEYLHCEPALDPNDTYDRKLEDYSLVVIENDSNNNVIGCQTNYFLSRTMISEKLKGFQEIIDRKEDDMLHEYCKHRVKVIV